MKNSELHDHFNLGYVRNRNANSSLAVVATLNGDEFFSYL